MTTAEHRQEASNEPLASAEWQARVDLAAAYRLVALYGWDDLIFTHLSVRVPGPEVHFLINPYGLLFEEVTPSSLVKVDLECRKVVASPYEVNPAGFLIHSAIHRARDDAHCVMHLHTPEGIAVSAQKDGLLPLSQQSIFPLASLAYHDYEGVVLTQEEQGRLVADLGGSSHLILRNHGLLVAAHGVADAFLMMYTLQNACRIQLLAQAGGGELTRVPAPVLEGARRMADKILLNVGGHLAWPGLLRKLDRIDPDWRR